MKKIFSFLIAALFSASMWADITVGAKVPAEWDSGTISVFTWTNNTDGAMHETTHNSGWYTYTYTGDVPVNIIFVNGSDWTGGDPNQTVDITNVSADSYYEVTYNQSGKCTAEYIGGGYIGVHGDMTTTDWETIVLDLSADKATASHTYTLEKGNWYHFGMRIGSSGNWTASSLEFKRSDDPKTIPSGEGQCYFQADKDGDYVFTWTYKTSKLTIKFPDLVAYDVTVSPSEHVSISVLNGESAIGAKVDEFTELTVSASATDPAYLVKNLRAYKTGDESTEVAITDGKLTMPSYAITITADEAARRLANGFYLKKTTVALEDITSALKFSDADGQGERTLTTSLTEGDLFKVVEITDDAIVGWYPNGTDNDYPVYANYAGTEKIVYFRQADYDGDGWWYKHIYVPENPVDPTAIDNTEAGNAAVKRLVNGQLVIVKGDKTFNALGAEVK